MANDKLAPDVAPTGVSKTRRDFVSAITGASLMAMVPPGIRGAAWAAGSDAPEKKEVKIGFIPLTDCASVVMAAVNKFDEKYGIKIIPTKEASWASVRDKLVNGELDAAHVLHIGRHLVVAKVGPPEADAEVDRSRLQGQLNLVAGMKADSDTGNGSTKCALCVHGSLSERGHAQTS